MKPKDDSNLRSIPLSRGDGSATDPTAPGVAASAASDDSAVASTGGPPPSAVAVAAEVRRVTVERLRSEVEAGTYRHGAAVIARRVLADEGDALRAAFSGGAVADDGALAQGRGRQR